MSIYDLSTNLDAVTALVHLAGRAGANDLEIGYARDDVPVDQAGWYARANYRGAQVVEEEYTTPGQAAIALARRLLTGGTCRCGRTVRVDWERPLVVRPARRECRWRLIGDRWVAGCNSPSVLIPEGVRGDLGAMREAFGRLISGGERP